MTITVTFDPPVPSDSPAVFNTKAFTLLGDLNDWTAEANALAVEVNADEVALAAAVSSASTSASTATTQSGAATTQAGIATTKAGEAATSAGTAATQAGTATTQAGIATTKAGEANTSAIAAAGSAAATSSAIVTERTNAATLTNKTLTSPDINGGTVDGTVIGGAVPVAGSFTTLSASGGLSVTGGISATGVVSTSGGIRSGNGVIDTGFSYSDKGVVGTYSNHSLGFMVNESEKMTLDASGNLGLGVVPSAWGSAYRAIQVGTASMMGRVGGSVGSWSVDNAYYNGTNPIYIVTAGATQYEQGAGVHKWYTAPSGTAGQPISFVQAMTLDASGNLNIANLTASKAVFTDASKNLTTTGTLGVAQGGTGATTASAALTALGAYAATNPSGYTTNVGDVTLAGTQTLTNKTITDIVFTLTGTTPAFLATNGAVQTWALTGNSTPTDSLTSGQSIILAITPGSFTITWPSVVWTKQGGSGTAPTLFSTGKTMIVLWKVGTTLYGSHLGDTA